MREGSQRSTQSLPPLLNNSLSPPGVKMAPLVACVPNQTAAMNHKNLSTPKLSLASDSDSAKPGPAVQYSIYEHLSLNYYVFANKIFILILYKCVYVCKKCNQFRRKI